MSLEHEIHELRSAGLSFAQIGARIGLTKDQTQKRYQKFLLSNPLPHTPTPEGDGLFSGGSVKRVTPRPPQRTSSISNQLTLSTSTTSLHWGSVQKGLMN